MNLAGMHLSAANRPQSGMDGRGVPTGDASDDRGVFRSTTMTVNDRSRAGMRTTERLGTAMAALVMLATDAPAQNAQLRVVQPIANVAIAPVPFAVGEELVYRATFGGIPAG